MSTIHQVLDSFAQLGELIYKGSETECFVQPQRCLFLADQLTALTWELRDKLRAGRLPEALALRDLDDEPASQADRLAAFGETIGMAVDAAEDTLEAVTLDKFRRARQRVSEGIYLLWHIDAMLTTLFATSDSALPGDVSTNSLFIPKPEDER